MPPRALGALLIVVVAGLHAAAADLPVVAVFNIEVKQLALRATVRQSLSDYLAAQLASSGAFSVVPRDRIKRELTKQRKASYKDCYSQSCQIEIGQELAAQKAISAASPQAPSSVAARSVAARRRSSRVAVTTHLFASLRI